MRTGWKWTPPTLILAAAVLVILLRAGPEAPPTPARDPAPGRPPRSDAGALRVPRSRPEDSGVSTGVVDAIVLDAKTRQPLPGARMSAGDRVARSDSDGVVALPVRAPATGGTIRFEAPGYEAATVPAPSAPSDLGEIPLRGLGRLRCRVLDADRIAISGAEIRWRTAPGPTTSLFSHRVRHLRHPKRASSATAVTDSGGRAVLEDVPTSVPVYLEVLAAGVPRGRFGPFQAAESSTPETRLVLEATHHLRVGTGLPAVLLARARLRVVRDTPTDVDRAEFETQIPGDDLEIELPEGAYVVSALLDGQIVAQAHVELTTDRDVRLEPGSYATVSLRVEDESGEPVPRFEVQAVLGPPDPPGPMGFFLFTGATTPGRDGHVERVAVPAFGHGPGSSSTAHVAVRAPGMGVAEARFPVGAGGTAVGRVVLTRAATVVGAGRGLAGLPVSIAARRLAAIRAVWDSAGAPEIDRVVADERGAFRLSTCGAGTYEVRIGAPGRGRPVATFEVPDRGELRVEVAYRPATVRLRSARPGVAPPDVMYVRTKAGRVVMLHGVSSVETVEFLDVPAGHCWVGPLATMPAPEAQVADDDRYFELSEGETREITWNRAGRGSLQVRLRTAARSGESAEASWLVTLVPLDAEAPLAAALPWTPVLEGLASIRRPWSVPARLLVAVKFRAPGSALDGTPVVFAGKDVPPEATACELRIEPPGMLTVRTEPSRALRFSLARADEPAVVTSVSLRTSGEDLSLPLPPGRWTVSWPGIRILGDGTKRPAILARTIAVPAGEELSVVLPAEEGR